MKRDGDPAPIGVTGSLTLFPDAEPEGDPRIRALSLWQPHATAIALGLKPYETRGWPTDYRGPMVVHAALKRFRHQDYPPAYFQEAGAMLKRAGCPVYALRYGEAMCIVDVLDCVPTESLGMIGSTARFWGDFSPGRFAFKLGNVRKIRPPVRATGHQKFFSITIPRSNEALR
jgi:hypothetical protein